MKVKIEEIILLSLLERDLYGNDISKIACSNTGEDIKQPTLYKYLKKLENEQLISSYWGEESLGGRRKYYKLTVFGASSAKQIQQNSTAISLDCLNDGTNQQSAKQTKVRDFSQEKLIVEDVSKKIQEIQAATLATSSTYSSDTVKENPYLGNAINPNESDSEKKYKTILNNLIGEQLRKMPDELLTNKSSTSEQVIPLQINTPLSASSIADVADKLCSKGIKVKLYNQYSSSYKYSQMLFTNKLDVVSSLISSIIILLLIGLCFFIVSSNNINITLDFLIILLLSCVGLHLLYCLAMFIFNPNKKINCKLDHKYRLVNSLIAFSLCLLFIVIVNLLIYKTNFNKVYDLIYNFFIPAIISFYLVLYPTFNRMLYKKMLTC